LGELTLFASYTKPQASIYNTGSYDESMSYDKNGNIISLQRNGEYDDLIQNLTIDNLVYTYNDTSSPNQLLKVVDNTSNPNGFKDGVNTGNDYAYDAYGNMTLDNNKGITLIKYNHLNLPTQITFGSTGNIQYIYNASGVKVRKVVTQGTSVQTTDYLSGFQYINNILEFFPHAEGYVKKTTNSYNYVFNYTDHLGNIRLSYTKDPATNVLTILEENNYYPFGLKHRNYNMTKKTYEKLESTGGVVITPTNQTVYDYKYNGKEWQDELGLDVYDYGARVYDPAAPRFWQIDPHAETYFSLSPYNYVAGNPVSFTDPDGKDILFYVWEKNAKEEWVSKQVSFKQLDPGLQKALESFAKTDVGYSFFEGFAKKGDKIGGVSFNKDGKDSKHDLSIGQFYEQGAPLGTSSVREGKDNIVFDMKLNMGRDTEVDNLESLTLTTGHEAFLHMNLYKDNIIGAYDKGDKKEVNKIIAKDRQNAQDGGGRKDHLGYLQFNPIYNKFKTFVTQLKTVLNPAKVNEAKKQHDEKLRKTTN
jgi:RHS repeat-associated protein